MHFVYVFTAKFVVSSCPYCKLRRDFGFFCSVNHLSEGEVNANHNVTPPSLAKNDSRLLKNSEGNRDGEWIFCRRKEADVALLLQVTGIRKITKICEANFNLSIYPQQDDHKATNLETWNKPNGSKSNHELLQANMCFLRSPLRWLTEQKNPKFAKRTARYNGFHYNW